jgi:hypothetical protein
MFSIAIIFPSMPRAFLDVYMSFFTATVVKGAIVESWERMEDLPCIHLSVCTVSSCLRICGRRHCGRSCHSNALHNALTTRL